MDTTSVVLVIIVAFFVGLPILILYISKQNQINSEWTGSIVDKNTQVIGSFIGIGRGIMIGSGSGTQKGTLTVKTTAGDTKKITVSQGIYEMFKIGDKISKRKGEFNPTKG